MNGPTLKSFNEIRRDNLISDLDTLKENLLLMFTPEEMIEWLWAPNQLLNNQTPMFTLGVGQAKRVFDTVNQIAEGTYT